jgi:hypothetical protein
MGPRIFLPLHLLGLDRPIHLATSPFRYTSKSNRNKSRASKKSTGNRGNTPLSTFMRDDSSYRYPAPVFRHDSCDINHRRTETRDRCPHGTPRVMYREPVPAPAPAPPRTPEPYSYVPSGGTFGPNADRAAYRAHVNSLLQPDESAASIKARVKAARKAAKTAEKNAARIAKITL